MKLLCRVKHRFGPVHEAWHETGWRHRGGVQARWDRVRVCRRCGHTKSLGPAV